MTMQTEPQQQSVALAQAPALPPNDPARSSFELAQRRATVLSRSSLVPQEYQGDRGMPNCMIALNLADRIGADPFAVIQNLDIIHGKPGLRSTFLIATVNACNRFTPLRPRMEGKPGTDSWGCRAVAKDRETGEECAGPLITIGIAKNEGWYQRKGSKWQTMPELMLTYRAAAFWTRIYAPELSLGIRTADELGDVYGHGAADMPQALTPVSAKSLETALLAASIEPESTPAPAEEPVTVDEGGAIHGELEVACNE
jgi:hypothetical protein